MDVNVGIIKNWQERKCCCDIMNVDDVTRKQVTAFTWEHSVIIKNGEVEPSINSLDEILKFFQIYNNNNKNLGLFKSDQTIHSTENVFSLAVHARTYGCYITHLKWPATVVCFKRGYGMCGASLLDHNQQVDSGRFFFSILSRCNNGRADAVRRTVCNKSRSTSAISPTAAPKVDDDWIKFLWLKFNFRLYFDMIHSFRDFRDFFKKRVRSWHFAKKNFILKNL